ncbi:polysaccharide deacetylase [Pontibacter ummariensis]|uniref:Polysaccharide deacetylase n=1 Tax=Pontibacter ummariensis TaxID=1610492 RepID=A0A239GFR2_9BACT|nr:polysaccharide deacetylase family protein [Pontibacter ummariensis]PRY11247.1 polysaccharide deacetylase [Pontibacter ummariensis]SNS68037.1 Polysaccharide deacetylase [Pontibacter ummariensis]
MKTAFRKAIHQLDVLLAPLVLATLREQNAFNTYLFHALFKDREELKLHLCDPQQQVTVGMFRDFVIYHLEKGYTFVSVPDVLKGLEPDKKYLMITFDDGYYNNHRALPILEEFQVPATFFVSVNHVLQEKAFWWDVAYREGKKAGKTDGEILAEKNMLLSKTDDEVERYLEAEYGERAFQPVSDTDRPMTADELRKFSQHPLVHIGNHTCDHAVLPNYSEEGVERQIVEAQVKLERIIGYRPLSIAYPCGDYTNHTLEVCRREGIALGITVHHAKNFYSSLHDRNSLLTLNRFTIWGTEELKSQCDFYRSDYHILEKMRNLYHRIRPQHQYQKNSQRIV